MDSKQRNQIYLAMGGLELLLIACTLTRCSSAMPQVPSHRRDNTRLENEEVH